VSEARYVEMKSQLSRAEEALHKEEKKSAALNTQMAELTSLTGNHRAALKAKSDQTDILQVGYTDLMVHKHIL